MRNLFLFFVVLTTSLPLLAQQKNPVKKIFYSDGTLKEKFSYKILAGDTVRVGDYEFYYPSGNVYQRGSYADGKIVGKFYIFYESGKTKTIFSFADGKKNGEFQIFYESGSVRQAGAFSDDKLDGRIIDFAENSDTIRFAEYKSGVLDGEFCEFDGKFRRESFTFIDSKIQGLYKKYYPTGELNLQGIRKGENLEGQVSTYYRFGNKAAEMYFSQGVKNGIETTFFENGNVMNVSKYVAGTRNGEYIANYSNGNLAEKGCYVGGRRAGIWTSFYSDGKTLYTTGEYKDGEYFGLWRIFYSDGTLKKAAVFDMSSENGHSEYFSPSGEQTYKGFSAFGSVL